MGATYGTGPGTDCAATEARKYFDDGNVEILSQSHSLNQAITLAARGWAVFPLKPRSKEPATRRGFYDATSNPATVRRWFSGDYPHNIGVATGAASGVVVIDIDGPEGEARLAKLGDLSPTLKSKTGRGVHLWFTCKQPVPNSAGRIAPQVDVRGDGGYVVAPPSIHPNGSVYRWTNDLAPAPLPDWLLRLARKPERSISERAVEKMRSPHLMCGRAYGRAALADEVKQLAAAVPGTRNVALNKAAFVLGQLIAGGELDAGEVKQQLVDACHRNGLIADDGIRSVNATMRSGAVAGMQSPRRRPQGGAS